MRIITRIIILAGCLVLLLASPSLGAAEDDGKLEAINKEIGVIDARLATLKKSEKSLLNDIYGIELRYEKALIENNKVKLQLRNTNQQINQKSSEKKLLEQEIVKSRKNLEKILRILYKIGGNAYLKLFVQIDSLDQLFKNYRLFESLISNQSDELEKLKKNILSLNRVNRELQTSYTSL
ncbi:MAG: hypothetical protein GY940_32260, partial [bacterium]|nr:hypothetical protein [bacterium]